MLNIAQQDIILKNIADVYLECYIISQEIIDIFIGMIF
jgi:hypothetical protein